MLLAHYLGLIHRAEEELGDAYGDIADHHRDEPDVEATCRLFAGQCAEHAQRLEPFVERYGEEADEEPERLHSDLFSGPRDGGLALLRDLHDLYLMATECDISWTLIGQAAQGARDRDLLDVVDASEGEVALQLAWLKTRLKQAAPQTLVVQDS